MTTVFLQYCLYIYDKNSSENQAQHITLSEF